MTPAKLKKTRKSLGLSLAQVSTQVRITARSWARYEAGERPIPEGVIHLFCLLNDLDYPPK